MEQIAADRVQSISDNLPVEVARHWKDASLETGGSQIRLQPGVIGARANQLLAPYGAKIGPDPASIATSSSIGGIVSNNSSGMCRGVDQNAYHTFASMRFMLLSGGVIDTAEPDADESSMRLSQSWRGYSSLKRTSRAIRASASGRTTSLRRISVNV